MDKSEEVVEELRSVWDLASEEEDHMDDPEIITEFHVVMANAIAKYISYELNSALSDYKDLHKDVWLDDYKIFPPFLHSVNVIIVMKFCWMKDKE